MKDQFEHILKDKLDDFSLKAEPDDWVKIERSLGLAKPKRIPLFRYAGTAAAVLLVGMLGLFLSRDPELMPVENLLSTGTESTFKEIIEQAVNPEENAIQTVLKLKEEIDRSNNKNTAGIPTRVAQAMIGGGSISEDPESIIAGTSTPKANIQDPQTEKNPASAQNKYRYGNTPAQNFSARNNTPVLRKNSKPNSNWALSLYADGSASGSKNQSLYTPQNMFAGLTDDSDTLVEYHVDGATGLLRVEVGEWDHDFPLTFGLMVRRNLNDRWGVELGLTYSYLSSKQELSAKMKQKLHYLGVPVAVTYTPLRLKNFDIYARAGGAADFNVSGRKSIYIDGGQTQHNSFTKSGVQWSVSGNLGFMYNISPSVGIYAEPGVSHYFKFSNQPESYWKEHPTNFNFKVGVRTTF